MSISNLNSHLNQFLVYRGIQPFNQIHKNSEISKTRRNCCGLAGEQPSFISTTAAAANNLSKSFEADEYYMKLALDQAQIAYNAGEVPVGAIIVGPTGDVIAAAHNSTERDGDPTAHAEMLCIRHATGKAKSAWRLLDATMYVTLEPCPMCAGALLQARVGRVVYGAKNKLLGADGSWINMMRGWREAAAFPAGEGSRGKLEEGPAVSENSSSKSEDGDYYGGGYAEQGNSSSSFVLEPHRPHPFHPDLQVDTGILEEQCSGLMKDFFKERRRQIALPIERKE
jgi:tRNA(adenine34) deaminase